MALLRLLRAALSTTLFPCWLPAAWQIAARRLPAEWSAM